MIDAEFDEPLEVAAGEAKRWIAGLDSRPVRPDAGGLALLKEFDEALPTRGEPAEDVVRRLARGAQPGLIATGSGRFYGWVIGGTLPAALASDWLVSAWDQNAVIPEAFPAVCAIEQVAAKWVLELLGLPAHCSVGFVTGGQMANTVCLAAARNHVLAANGWDVEAEGLAGAPALKVVAGRERHTTIDRSLRLLGLGDRALVAVEVDDAGRISLDSLEDALRHTTGPVIVCAQAGNVNGGALDPVDAIREVLYRRRDDDVWLHVDGAFGLWARADPSRRQLLDGVERADSWAVDAHKWLNTPYDCGMAISSRPDAHRRAMQSSASYIPASDEQPLRNPLHATPELSRRARAVPVWAALRQLGSEGVAEMVSRCCDMAGRFARSLEGAPGVDVMHQELNQVVVAFRSAAGTEHSAEVLKTVQEEGTCYPSATVWKGVPAIRISVSNWRTDEDDVDRSVKALLAAHEACA
jgi:glutamate/tyrosine decarboxylase-like PLP-dependent enzyme